MNQLALGQKNVLFSMDQRLIDEVDTVTKQFGISKSKFVCLAVKQYIDFVNNHQQEFIEKHISVLKKKSIKKNQVMSNEYPSPEEVGDINGTK